MQRVSIKLNWSDCML